MTPDTTINVISKAAGFLVLSILIAAAPGIAAGVLSGGRYGADEEVVMPVSAIYAAIFGVAYAYQKISKGSPKVIDLYETGIITFLIFIVNGVAGMMIGEVL